MKRRWNLSIWAGFLIVLAAPVTYLTVFVRFPATRDVPWATFLMFALGIGLSARGLRRAIREPRVYRGRIAGSILLSLGVACFALFATGHFYLARQVPASAGAPRVGERAPGFSLPDTDGNRVTLAGLLDGGGARINGVLLIFYRGYW
jgi:hypothetical protein